MRASEDSRRAALDPDHRLEEMRSYSRPHVPAITEPRK